MQDHGADLMNQRESETDRRDWFCTTRWSLVLAANHGSDGKQAAAAMQSLCETYWVPLYSYVRCRGYSADDAQDLTQEFFARLLAKNSMAAANPRCGKFRSFLLATLKNFLCDDWDKSRALKRGGAHLFCSLEFADGERTYELEPVNYVSPEQIYERRWALTLLAKVMNSLEQDYSRTGNEKLFAALRPCLIGERAAQPYASLAAELGTTESAIKSMVHRLRGRYRVLLRAEIASTLAAQNEVDEELGYLFEILGRKHT